MRKSVHRISIFRPTPVQSMDTQTWVGVREKSFSAAISSRLLGIAVTLITFGIASDAGLITDLTLDLVRWGFLFSIASIVADESQLIANTNGYSAQ
jgi:hypothetical protein